MECSICYNPIVDKVSMTCSSQHTFCFKCLLKSIETNHELKSCPNCRGGDKFIMITGDLGSTEVNDFHTLVYFKKSLPLLQKILNDSVNVNTCLISELLLVCYVRNKKQLDIAHRLLGLDYKIEDIVPLIKWDSKNNFEDMGLDFLTNLATEMFGNQIPPQSSHPPPPPPPRTARASIPFPQFINGLAQSGMGGLGGMYRSGGA